MDGRLRVTPLVVYVAGLVILAAATTSAYLAMRDVMAIGGSCASGGPYEVAVPCPKGTGTLMVGGIFGWFVGAGLTVVGGSQLPGNYASLALLAWPGLFLSLGWNFLDFGFDPADGSGTDGGLVFCGILFFLMGGVPLLFGLKGLARALWPAAVPDEAAGRWRLSAQVRAATSHAPVVARRRKPRRPAPAPAREPEDAPPQDAGPQDAVAEDAVAEDAGPQDAVAEDASPVASRVEDASPAVGQAVGRDIARELERLADLHGRGAIDDDEFERAKDILLGAGEDRS